LTMVTRQRSVWGFPAVSDSLWRYSRPAAHKDVCFLLQNATIMTNDTLSTVVVTLGHIRYNVCGDGANQSNPLKNI